MIFLFTDGEEPGLLGAEAFFGRDRCATAWAWWSTWRREATPAARPCSRPEPTAATSIRLYAGAAYQPTANSLAAAVYRRMPNDTDFTHALRKGLPGLNFAFIDDQLAYRTPWPRPST